MKLTQNAEPVVDGDNDEATIARQHAAVVRISTVPLVAFAVQENDHRITLAAAASCASCAIKRNFPLITFCRNVYTQVRRNISSNKVNLQW